MSEATEAGAIARLQEWALKAATAMKLTIPDLPPPAFMMMTLTRDRSPRGESIQLIANIKSPKGKLLSVHEVGGRYQCIGRFAALDMLAFCMAKLEELGAPCPVEIALQPPEGREHG